MAQWLGGSAETWLRAQLQYDLWHAEKNSKIKVKPVVSESITALALPTIQASQAPIHNDGGFGTVFAAKLEPLHCFVMRYTIHSR